MIGLLLNKRYRLDSELGRGGMGVVFRAHDTLLQREVAIKVITTDFLDEERHNRILHEARAAARLNHPNIASVFDAGEATLPPDGEPISFIVGELVEGRSLFERRPESLDEILAIARQICLALDHAHTHDVVHLDLKPENILLTFNGTVKLLDFGLAHLIAPRSAHDRRIVGTVSYMAPEIAQGQDFDGRTDLYALGAILYEMTTGTPPFTADDPMVLLSQHLHEPVIPPQVHNPNIPPQLDDLIVTLLSKRPEDRPASASEVLSNLELAGSDPKADNGSSMAHGLLSTKLQAPPARPDLVPRQRLIERLREGWSKKLTLVSAPAGFGKTTLLSAWQMESGLPTAWLTLDLDDNEPTRFLSYVATALQRIAPEVGRTSLVMLFSTQTASLENALTALINELSSVQHHFCLFLDDYHLIDAAEIHSTLTYLIEHLPPKMHLVLASRSDPPLPLSRLRVRSQLIELRQEHLRFTLEEASTFLNRCLDLDLTTEHVAALEARTEGWIAGLQLAGLSMRGKQDISTFIQAFSGSHRFVIDYLADEVLSQQPTELRRFLQQTSILERFTASLCDAVTGRDDSALLLKQLEESNLFLIPLDDHRRWYRYHHLFSDYLRTELDEESKVILHKKAAKWLVSRELYAEGVRYALASRDTEAAVKVISLAIPEAFNQASFETLLRWLNTLPEATVLGNSELVIYKAFALYLARSPEEARPYVTAAEQTLSRESPSPVQGLFMSLKAHITLCDGMVDETIQLSREALEYLDDNAFFFRNLTLNVLGQVLELKGDVASAADVYRQAFKAGWQAGDQPSALLVFTNLIFSLNELGRRREAVALCEQLVATNNTGSVNGLALVDAVYLPWSLLSLEANELDIAQEHVQRALDMLSAINFSHGIIWGLYILARLHLAKGELDAMRKLTREGFVITSQMGTESIQGAWFAALEAQADLYEGNRASLASWAERGGFSAHDSPHHWAEQPYLTYVRLLLSQERLVEAQGLLKTMGKAAQQGGRVRKLITIHILQAWSLLASTSQDRGLALEHFERALKLAEPGDYRRAFLDEGQKIVPLLTEARPAAPMLVDELLATFRVEAAAASQTTAALDSLTGRELEVLRLVAKGLSNREIAEALVVSLGTVKKHLNNTFSKLDVKSRTQAVIKGKELGLLR